MTSGPRATPLRSRAPGKGRLDAEGAGHDSSGVGIVAGVVTEVVVGVAVGAVAGAVVGAVLAVAVVGAGAGAGDWGA
ncbi:hypothetical protein ABZX40_23060 [Streptomyces sp. NPDC004610]|uniref:hypothetical protein n=1 Tax=unclassified Streptomyces TaxID=2593676 RepID=UPI0033A5A76A